MAGVKGRSGRRTHYDELAIAEVVNLSIKTVREYLQDIKMPLEKRAQLAQAFVAKAMPQRLEAEGLDTQIIIVRDRQLEGNRIGTASEAIPG